MEHTKLQSVDTWNSLFHTYILILLIYTYIYSSFLLHSCDYQKKTSIKIYVVTDEGNIQNEI